MERRGRKKHEVKEPLPSRAMELFTSPPELVFAIDVDALNFDRVAEIPSGKGHFSSALWGRTELPVLGVDAVNYEGAREGWDFHQINLLSPSVGDKAVLDSLYGTCSVVFCNPPFEGAAMIVKETLKFLRRDGQMVLLLPDENLDCEDLGIEILEAESGLRVVFNEFEKPLPISLTLARVKRM